MYRHIKILLLEITFYFTKTLVDIAAFIVQIGFELVSSVQELFLLHQALNPDFLSNQQLLRNGVS